jgi:uncharacterized Zn finger protein (UPF0148 family)
MKAGSYCCPICKTPLKRGRASYECPKCHKAFVVKQGQLLSLGEDEDVEEKEEDVAEDKGADENKKIDDDIVDLEMLDFFKDDL